jgi:hypothetical protein
MELVGCCAELSQQLRIYFVGATIIFIIFIIIIIIIFIFIIFIIIIIKTSVLCFQNLWF